MKYFGLSNKVKVRGNNEDYFHIPLKNDNAKLFVVADGMGGANAGEIASALAVSAVVCFGKNESALRYESERKTIENTASMMPEGII